MLHDDSIRVPLPSDVTRRVFAAVRRAAVPAAGVALSIGCLYLAMRGTDLRQVGSTLAAANLWFVLPLIVVQVLFYALKAIRWRLLLMPVASTSARRLVAPMMIGFMGNNLLPARLGELIRLHLGARLLQISHSQVLATLVLERLFDFIAVLALFGVGVALLPEVPHSLLSAGYVAASVSAVAMLGTAIYAAWTGPTLRLARWATQMLPAPIARGILRQLELGASGMGSLRRPHLLTGIAVASLAQWFLMAVCIYVSFRAVSIDAPLAAAFIVLAATVFGVMVPAAPGFFGTLHLAFVLALSPFAIGDNRAMAAAVFYHIIPYVGVILVGGVFVRQLGLRLQEIEREAVAGQPAR